MWAGIGWSKSPVYDNPAQVDADYALQGEYTGITGPDHDQLKVGMQVIAFGNGKLRAVMYRGGLPGDGWNKGARLEAEATLQGGKDLVFEQSHMRAVLRDGKIHFHLETITADDPTHDGILNRVVRESPTLGKKAPHGAVVLFDGTSADPWTDDAGKPVAMVDGLLPHGIRSKARFQNHYLHLEFRTPYHPFDVGQHRGNSGLYLQGRYELQILDSFGLSGEQNECGGVYSIARPEENMCYPPLQWQTYDVYFTAAKFHEGGRQRKPARATILHNGVVIQDNLELPTHTGGNPLPAGPEPGFIYLQDHGNLVRFRNIWVLEIP